MNILFQECCGLGHCLSGSHICHTAPSIHSRGQTASSLTSCGIFSTIILHFCCRRCPWKKVVALNFPLFERRCCNVRRAKVGTSLIALAVAALEVQFFFIIKEKTDSTGKEQCYFIRVPQSYILIFNPLDATLYSFYPFAVMGFTNIAIIYKFTKAKLSNRKKGTNSTAQALARSHMRDVATLVSVSVMFIVLTGPASAIYATTHNPHPTIATIVFTYWPQQTTVCMLLLYASLDPLLDES